MIIQQRFLSASPFKAKTGKAARRRAGRLGATAAFCAVVAFGALGTLAAVSSSAMAQQDVSAEQVTTDGSRQFVLDLGVGVRLKPKYPGSDEYLVFPFPLIAVGRLYVPGFGQVVDGKKVEHGLYFFPSFGFNGKRKASDSSDLTGTRTVDWALELGAGVGYKFDWAGAFIAARQGINGHSGQVVDLGLNFIAQPTQDLTLTFGPRASWASSEYMRTYFGVTPAEAAAPGSTLSAYRPGAGFKSVGVSARASYDWNDKTTLHLRAGWERFVSDADKSPIIKAGSENQFTVGIGASYRFAFDVFD